MGLTDFLYPVRYDIAVKNRLFTNITAVDWFVNLSFFFFIKQPKYSCTLNSAIGLLWNSCQSRRISIKMPLVAESTFIVKRFPIIVPFQRHLLIHFGTFPFICRVVSPYSSTPISYFKLFRPMVPFFTAFWKWDFNYNHPLYILFSCIIFFYVIMYSFLCFHFVPKVIILFYFIFAW